MSVALGPEGTAVLILVLAAAALASYGLGYAEGRRVERETHKGGPDDQGRDDWKSNR